MKINLLVCLLIILAFLKIADAILVWPTPNPAFKNDQPITDYVQATASGNPKSGLFGCVRNKGSRFHEGLDLRPTKWDSLGEAVDLIYAVQPGKIAYVCHVPSHSSYGRYVVIEHDGEIPVYHTLYAHLASIADSIVPGNQVEAGTVIGIMGRSANHFIPRTRAHLHFEVGLRLSNEFQIWYDRQQFESINRHGIWNGMNLVSIDPLHYFKLIRQGEVSNFYEYLRLLPIAARIRVFSSKIPDFVKNYNVLVTKSFNKQSVVAWDIAFTQYGFPKEWTPRFSDENLSGKVGDVKVIAFNPNLIQLQKCSHVIAVNGQRANITLGTVDTIKKLFGFK